MESEYLETILRCHYQERTIDKVLWIKSEPAVPSGQNFLSRVTRVKVGVVLGSGAKRTVSVVVKEALETVAGQWTINSGLFLFETKIFTNVLSKMTDLMYEFGDKREQLWANLIAHRQKTIVLKI
uniref:Uncharacterized protein n=1 Tax=Rhodnius prolixus TaxID=13249 RepID=T1HIU9_RHOPR